MVTTYEGSATRRNRFAEDVQKGLETVLILRLNRQKRIRKMSLKAMQLNAVLSILRRFKDLMMTMRVSEQLSNFHPR